MTLPNGSAGVNPNLQFGVGLGELQNLPARTQDAVAAILKSQIQLSAAWTGASAAVYEGLRSGINYALAIIEAIVQRLFATVETFPGVSQALDFIQHVPGVQELTQALTGVTGDLSDLATYVAGKWNTLASLVNDIADFIAAAGQTALADVGTALVNAANLAQTVNTAIGTLISNVGGTVIGDVSTAINTAATNAGDAISQLNDLIVGAGGVNIGDVATEIVNAANNAASATGDLVALIAGMGAADIHGVVTGLLATANAADDAVNDLTTLITGVLGGSHTVADLVAYLNAIPGSAIAGITAIEQAILDAIANALGHSGTGHTPSDIQTYLANIPGSVVSGITGGLQTTLDAISNALGVSGTGHTPANVQTYLGAIPGGNLTGPLNTAVTIGGQTVSSLFNGTGQFIGVLNSAATGTLNSAITVGATTIGTVATNANAAVTNINSLISNVGGTVIADVNTFINTASTNAQGSLNAIVNGVNNSAVTGQTIAQAQTAVNNFVSGVVNNLQGIAGTFGLSGANSAFAASASAQAAAVAQITAQQSAFNAVFNVNPATAGNVNVTVDFTSMSNQAGMSGIMLPGTGSGNGYMGVTSGAAAWQGGAAGTDVEVFPTQAGSDYIVADFTLGPLNDLLGAVVDLYLIFRCNSARNTYCFIQLFQTSGVPYIYIGCVVSGFRTVLATSAAGALSTIASGGKFRVIAGDPSSLSPYAMQVLYNGTPVITYTDTSHVSQLGASYRYTGLGMDATPSGKYPPTIKTVTYQDNPPASASYPFSGTPTAGTKGRMYVSNDVGLIQRDNGSAWEYVWGGPLGYLTKPPSSSWSWVNQGTASTATELGGERITAPSSTRNFRLRTRTLTPSSNYSAVAYVESAGVPVGGSNLWLGGIGLRNSSSGSFISFGPYLDNTTFYSALAVYRWTNATTISANSFGKPVYQIAGGAIPNWYRIRDDGTNRYFDYSTNGVDWITVFSEGRTAFITPDQFCFGFDNEGSGADCIIRLRSLSGIS